MRVYNLKLRKELIILDFESKEIMQDRWNRDKENGFPKMMHDGKIWKPILNGLELTEEDYRSLIADEDGGISISKHPKAYLVSYSRHKNAFKDLIEKQGFYWLENPNEEPDNVIRLGSPFDNLNIEDLNNWKEAESRTLRFPIIFEILE